VSRSVVVEESVSSRLVSSRTQRETSDVYQGNNIVSETIATTTDKIRTTTNVRETTTTTFTTDRTFTDLFFEKREGGLEGYDFELGYKFPLADTLPEVRLFGGYYDFEGPFESEIKGAKGRLEVRAGEYFTFDAEVFEDEELHGSDYFVGARLNLPFSFSNLVNGRNPFLTRKHDMITFRNRSLAARLGEEVIRDVEINVAESEFAENLAKRETTFEQEVRQEVDVVETSSSRDRREVSVDVDTDTYTVAGDDIAITHVDSNAAGADVGTFEDPNQTLTSANATQAADANDIVLIHSNSSFSGETVEVTDDQMLIGQGGGIQTTIATDQGDLVLPEAGDVAGSVPEIDGGGVLINSNNVTVTNVNINNGSIDTAAGGSHSNLTITNVSVSNSSDDAISLGSDGGTLDGTITLSDITITGAGDDGLEVQNLQSTGQLNASNITISDSADDGIDFDNILANATITGQNINITNSGDAGITIFEVGAGANSTFTDLAIMNSGTDGIRIEDAVATSTFSFTNFDSMNSGDDGCNKLICLQ